MTKDYAERVFRDAEYDVLSVKANDTIIVTSDGVIDNTTQGQIHACVSKVYEKWHSGHPTSPTELAQQLVDASISGAPRPGGKPDDTTCTVAYVYSCDSKKPKK